MKNSDAKTSDEIVREAEAWWKTEIIDIHPGKIAMRGYPIEELIGAISFPQMIWLMVRGDLPTAEQSSLLEAALVAAVDHGPQAPSIAISRMAVTCGVELNNAMASAINVLAGIHGGAGQQCMELYADAARRMEQGATLEDAVEAALDAYIAENGKVIPGFGHRFHPIDPRSGKLLELVEAARAKGVVGGLYSRIGQQVEAILERRKGKRIPMNIDGATAVIYAELGFAPELGRGLFILSRSVGILAHAWEQSQQGGRIKGPMPKSIPYTYAGPARRAVPEVK
ncbi:citryl-CoA lyase [Aromatoleum diolicum]|uniref:citrate synthase (unknown stereospecificity) n=1 Tax=Aromatoleum diolicum TaxID=75796 RepID=A0ABX1QB12_9RHOO|nr:citryl-CoA lyase [Aromatoleum diolicum]NMG74705.1 citryl-CoA lyase [Aromatoleum diolicum]